MPRWPPESAGFSTAGTPTVSSAARALSRSRAPAKRGCGTPASASVRRIAILCVIRCAVSVPIPGSPSASATAATTGTARSAETVRTPSTPCRRATSVTAATSVKSTASPSSAAAEPGRVRVAVDRDDAEAELLRAQDRAALVAAGADEEDRAHVARDAIRRWARSRGASPAASERRHEEREPLDSARSRSRSPARSSTQTRRPRYVPRDQRLLRAAVLLGAHRVRRERRERVRQRVELRHAAARVGERAAGGVAAQRPRRAASLARGPRPERDP